MSMSENETEKKPEQDRLVTNVMTSVKDSDGVFKMFLPNGKAIGLNQLLGEVLNCRGEFKSLGMAYDNTTGVNAMTIVIYIAVPSQSPIGQIMLGNSQEIANNGNSGS